MQTVYYIILVPMVYLAVAVFVFGTAVRLVKIFKQPNPPNTLQIYPEKHPSGIIAVMDALLFPTVRRHQPVLWVFLMAFHICLLLLLIGHIELIGHFRFLQVIPHRVFLGKGFVGLIAAISLLYFLFRRFRSPVKELSVPEDYYLLILLFLIVLFGSEMDWARRWYDYGNLTVEDYRVYLSSLVRFQPEVPYYATFSGHSFMLIVHVFLANVFLILFPFSHALHAFLTIPMNKLRRG